MRSRQRRAISRRRGSSSQMRSRPARLWTTRPAPASACRCLVTAWRVTPLPSLSRVIDSGPSTQSRATSASRVGSPSAANTGALSASFAATALRLLRDIALDVLHLLLPPALVHAEGFRATGERDAIEARLDDAEHRAAGLLFELELDERRRLRRVIDVRFDGARMPAETEQALGFDALHVHVHGDVFVARVENAAATRLALGEGALQLDAEPGSELLRA